MRGGHINFDKVRSYKNLLAMLCRLSVIDSLTYNYHEASASYINPLVKQNRIFVEPFNKINVK